MCYQCSQGDRCSFRHETQDRVQKPYHEVEVCRGRDVFEAKVIMVPFFDNRADFFERYLYANVFLILASARVPIL